MSKVIQFPGAPRTLSDAEQARLEELEDEGPFWLLEDEVEALGTPEEWLHTAILYLKTQTSRPDFRSEGMARVSLAAIGIVLGRLDEMESGRAPGGDAA